MFRRPYNGQSFCFTSTRWMTPNAKALDHRIVRGHLYGPYVFGFRGSTFPDRALSFVD